MCAAIRAAAASIRRGAEILTTLSPPSAPLAKSLSARIAFLAVLAGLGLTAPALENPAAAQPSDHAIIADGEAAVSGFSGASAMTPAPQGVDPVAVTFIDPNGPSARVIDLRAAGGPPQAQVLPAPKPFTVTAAQVGEVFAVALDKAVPPNIYLAASSAYGLPIVLPAVEPGKPPQRLADGAPGAAFMPGLFGPAAMQGGPGSIWRVDGASGAVSLFANVALDGAPNPGPALGGLAFDPASNSLFVADRATGMIHRFGLDGAEIGRFDHGVDGRKAAGLPPVAFDPAKRLDIANPNFHSQDPASWGYAPPERRVFGLAVHGGRLYYAVADGLTVWSVAMAPNGALGADARVELQVPPGDAPSEISKIVFDDRGRMILAERGAPTGAFDFLTLAQPATSRALRYRLVQPDAAAPPVWQAEPDEYAIGFAAALRNANGGVAIGYGYRPDGSLDPGACGGFLWTTGEQLRAAADPAVAAQLAASGPLPLNGLQGNDIEAVRPDNVPPLQSYFANYFDDAGNPAFHGHLGDIAIPRSCAESALFLPVPVTPIADWPGPIACPPEFASFGALCRPPRCPPGHGEGVQCCPRGTWPGANGECEPLRGGNLGCPIGAVPLRRADGPIACAWLARCPDGAQADGRGGCGRICPPGETAWRSRRCCGYGEIGLPDGRCCPERDVRDGKCVQACPDDEILLPDGQCCPRQDVHDGKCVGKFCPDDEILLPDGKCCPRQDVHDGKCVQACPEGAVRLPGGGCCPRQDVRDGECVHACNPGYRPVEGHCVIECPAGEAPGADNLCHRLGGPIPCPPGLTPYNGACVNLHPLRACGPGEFRRFDGACVPQILRRPGLPWRRPGFYPGHPGAPYGGPLGRPPGYPLQRGPGLWLGHGRGYGND